MDISKLTHGAKLVLGASIAFLIVSIFNWQEIDIGIASAGVEHVARLGRSSPGLLAIAIIVWEALRLAEMKIEIGLTPAMVTAALAILLLIFTVLKVPAASPTFAPTFWAWLGLLLAILVAVGAWAEHEDARRVDLRDGLVDEGRGRQRRRSREGRDRQGLRRRAAAAAPLLRLLRLRPLPPRPRRAAAPAAPPRRRRAGRRRAAVPPPRASEPAVRQPA